MPRHSKIDPELIALVRSLRARTADGYRLVEGADAILDEAQGLFEIDRRTLDMVLRSHGVSLNRPAPRRAPRSAMTVLRP